ncbi:hypothetical protein ACEZCY_08995 [Streptacidiphilus sp. N1-12]|uniref:Uncharacterized protein n=2 Tax=Streptacidiphilus alkalitolerans TaxID=3342712 RepID=A0ABV6VH36_9ACTN
MQPLLRTLLAPGRRWTTALLTGLLVLAAGALVWGLTGGSSAPPPVVAADLSGRPTACMAADQATASKNPDTKLTWAAMQHGAQNRKINIQQLVLPATSTQAKPYLAGLLAQHCDLVVTIGSPFGHAIPTSAHLAPTTRFLAIDAGTLPAASALTTIDGPSAAATVQAAVAALATQHS